MSNNRPTTEDAIALALEAHRGQTDRAGVAYIMHPLALMCQMHTDAERMVAVLHDAVEDSGLTLDDLRQRGYPDEVIAGVDALTHREGESYDAYVQRLKPNPIARKVKLADLTHNMDVRRHDVVSAYDCERLGRYLKAYKYLMSDD